MKQWFPLGKRSATDDISGDLQLEMHHVIPNDFQIPKSPQKKIMPKVKKTVHTTKKQIIKKPVITPPAVPAKVSILADSTKKDAKPFLKRKPYNVRFHKVDWTSVSSKTDSNRKFSIDDTKSTRKSSISVNSSKSKSKVAEPQWIQVESSHLSALPMDELKDKIFQVCECKNPKLIQMKCTKQLNRLFPVTSSKIPHYHKNSPIFTEFTIENYPNQLEEFTLHFLHLNNKMT